MLAAALAACLTLVLALTASGLSTAPAVERVSVAPSGAQAFGSSQSASLSAGGRYVAFSSDAPDVVPGDTNGVRDVFVHDRLTGVTERVSVSTGGGPANGASAGLLAGGPRISGDGRYVTFSSEASGLVPNDGNSASDVFVRDRIAGTIERVSVASAGEEALGDSVTPSISSDGRYVTFTSAAGNLVASDDNSDRDVFVRDRVAGATELVSVALDETPGDRSSGGLGAGPARITPNGRFVVFGSFATDLVAGDTNDVDDVFVRDRVAGTTERVSVASDGTGGNGHSVYGTISDDGRFAAFSSPADTLTPADLNGVSDVFLHDRDAGTTARLSDAPGAQANGASFFPAISGDASAVAYHSDATNLVAGDTNAATDVFRQDLYTADIERVSAPAAGESNGASAFAEISADGTVVAFESLASNLAGGDSNGARDVFVWGKPLRVAPPQPTPTRTPTPRPPLAGDGDCSGDVDSIDAALILQLAAGLFSGLPCADAADVNGDGEIDAIDAALVLQFVAGLLDELPPLQAAEKLAGSNVLPSHPPAQKGNCIWGPGAPPPVPPGDRGFSAPS